LSESALQAGAKLGAMPLEEGHWRRSKTPLRRLTRRERNVVLAGLATIVLALAVLVLVTAGDTQPGPGPGCIRASVAGRTGAELIGGCGARAVDICQRASRLEGIQAETVIDACHEAGIKF
jgi:predicted metal-binding membrane protein